ncbi:MAG TPA: hypothetical protein VIH99_12350 [Bdellovibrionota bacterium]|jgi:hypothetical protein
MERGISPDILLQHVENTAPWLVKNRSPLTPYTTVVLEAFDRLKSGKLTLSHFDYFSLCLSAHYSTVATFVPTDVDNQIRKHLWHPELPADVSTKMAEHALASLAWDFRPVTKRYRELAGEYVCGHQGEWFSVAVGAYSAHRDRKPGLAAEVLRRIVEEARTEALLFLNLKKAKEGVGLLEACTAIAHNLGDLDRVIDKWELPEGDALRKAAYKLGHERNSAFGPLQENLLEAGALNKAFMASENHRHYPLRKPKCLRRSIDFLLPLGPFFDSWGEVVARSKELTNEEKAEVAQALLDGFTKLSSPKVPLYGYARALRGLQQNFPGGPANLLNYLPARDGKTLSKGLIPELNRMDERAFSQNWAKRALQFLKI